MSLSSNLYPLSSTRKQLIKICHNTRLWPNQGFNWQATFFVNISAVFGSEAAPSQFDFFNRHLLYNFWRIFASCPHVFFIPRKSIRIQLRTTMSQIIQFFGRSWAVLLSIDCCPELFLLAWAPERRFNYRLVIGWLPGRTHPRKNSLVSVEKVRLGCRFFCTIEKAQLKRICHDKNIFKVLKKFMSVLLCGHWRF
jgi:hypothetical protein